MRVLRRFLGLAPADRKLAIKAAIWTVFVRVGLWVISYRSLSAFLDRKATVHKRGSVENRPVENRSVEDIVRAVSAVSRYVPKASCLTQALVAQTLLRRNGHPATLQIGVAKTPDNQFQAHAWIEGNGRVLIGGTEAGTYTPLRPLLK